MNYDYFKSIFNTTTLSLQPSRSLYLFLMILFLTILPSVSFAQYSYPSTAAIAGAKQFFCIDNSIAMTVSNVSAEKYVIKGFNYTFSVEDIKF